MTPKEAIECLKNEKLCILITDKNECTRECSKCDLVMETDTLLTAYDMAIEAIEKQIPKKPINQSEEYDRTYGNCPCCGEMVVDYPDDFRVCSNCGQAINWGEEE